jgi:hypothetical protein
MNHLRTTFIALPFVAAIALGACSDDDDGNDTATATEALTEAEFVTQANAICADAGTAAEEALGPIFEDFDAATPEQLEAAFEQMVELGRSIPADIGALAAPEALSEDVDAFVDAFDAANDDVEAGGAEAFFAQEGDPWASVNDQATELGLDECAEA